MYEHNIFYFGREGTLWDFSKEDENNRDWNLAGRRLSPDGWRQGLFNLLALLSYLPSLCLCNSWSPQRADEQMVVTWLGTDFFREFSIRCEYQSKYLVLSLSAFNSPPKLPPSLKSEWIKKHTQKQQTQPHPDISLKPLTPFCLFVE